MQGRAFIYLGVSHLFHILDYTRLALFVKAIQECIKACCNHIPVPFNPSELLGILQAFCRYNIELNIAFRWIKSKANLAHIGRHDRNEHLWCAALLCIYYTTCFVHGTLSPLINGWEFDFVAVVNGAKRRSLDKSKTFASTKQPAVSAQGKCLENSPAFALVWSIAVDVANTIDDASKEAPLMWTIHTNV